MSFHPLLKGFNKRILAIYILMVILVEKKNVTQYFKNAN
jgi:hypothetical protein